ncbi:MAG: hypothetical protein ILA06_08890 [Bacteroidaceae bacterium]|nr:hypothetical protein [Bacteroidaceae bacterium]
MKQSIPLNMLRTDKAILFAKNTTKLKERLAAINAKLEDFHITYDDEVTKREDIEAILSGLLGLKF